MTTDLFSIHSKAVLTLINLNKEPLTSIEEKLKYFYEPTLNFVLTITTLKHLKNIASKLNPPFPQTLSLLWENKLSTKEKYLQEKTYYLAIEYLIFHSKIEELKILFTNEKSKEHLKFATNIATNYYRQDILHYLLFEKGMKELSNSLLLASRAGSKTILKELVSQGYSFSSIPLIEEAERYKHQSIVQALKSNEILTDKDKYYKFCENNTNHSMVIKYLNQVSPNYLFHFLVCSAINYNFIILKYLLEERSLNPEEILIKVIQNYSPSKKMEWQGIIEYIVNNYKIPVNTLNEGLAKLTKLQNFDLIQLFIRKGANDVDTALKQVKATQENQYIISYLKNLGAC